MGVIFISGQGPLDVFIGIEGMVCGFIRKAVRWAEVRDLLYDGVVRYGRFGGQLFGRSCFGGML